MLNPFCHVKVVSSCVKAARGRQNCLKISISKYSHVTCLLIGFWGRWTHFWHLFCYLTAVGRHSTIGDRLRPINHMWERGDIDLIPSLIIRNPLVPTDLRTKVRHFSNRSPPEDKCGNKNGLKMIFGHIHMRYVISLFFFELLNPFLPCSSGFE